MQVPYLDLRPVKFYHAIVAVFTPIHEVQFISIAIDEQEKIMA